MEDKNVNVSINGGSWFCGVLTLIFITLKLAAIGVVATWSWIWVLSPLWVPLAFVCSLFACIGLFLLAVFLIAFIDSSIKQKKELIKRTIK